MRFWKTLSQRWTGPARVDEFGTRGHVFARANRKNFS